MSPEPDYSAESLADALRKLGVQTGDILFCHVSMGRLGRPSCSLKTDGVCLLLLRGLETVLGASGTLLLPTYTYSIGRNETFDPEHTPSTVGPFTEFFRKVPGVVRSRDPMLSVAGKGSAAQRLLGDLPRTCYGCGSVYERLRQEGAKICTIGLPLHWATFRHHIEEMAKVPFRFAKLFSGTLVSGGRASRETWSYHAPIRQDRCGPDGVQLQNILRSKGVCRTVAFGRSEIWCVDAEAYFQSGMEELARDPWLSAVGPACAVGELIARENERVGLAHADASSLDSAASMRQMADAISPLLGDPVSSAFGRALDVLAGQLPMTIDEYPSGTSCLGLTVPERWTCQEAFLETLDGVRLYDSAESSLCAMSYSCAFEGEISREELMAHLHVDSGCDGAVPFACSHVAAGWGFHCSQEFKDRLKDQRYRVTVRAETSFGSLKVGEAVVAGETPVSVVLYAHLDHPGDASARSAGAVVGIEVMRRLAQASPLKRTVRLVIASERFGSLLWISRRRELAPMLRAGLCLDVPGGDHPDAFRISPIEEFCIEAVGIEAPVFSTSRQDKFANAGPQSLEASVEVILERIRNWDRNA